MKKYDEMWLADVTPETHVVVNYKAISHKLS